MTIFQFVASDVVLVVAILFGIIGFMRGPRRELIVTLFILVAFLLTTVFEDQLVVWVNRFWRLFRIATSGALASDNPGPAIASVPSEPLIGNDAQRSLFRIIVFSLLVLFGYGRGGGQFRERAVRPLVGVFTLGLFTVEGQAQTARAPRMRLSTRLAGFVAGAVNGFLVAYYLLPRLVRGEQAVLVIPTLSTTLLQGRFLFIAFLALVAVIIFVGWARARGT